MCCIGFRVETGSRPDNLISCPGWISEVYDPRQKERDQHGKRKEDDMFSIWTGPDVTWSTTKEGYQTMLEYCLSENVRYSMHLKETEVDNEMCFRHYGKDIVDLLEEIGFLTDKMLAVHCVNLPQRRKPRRNPQRKPSRLRIRLLRLIRRNNSEL